MQPGLTLSLTPPHLATRIALKLARLVGRPELLAGASGFAARDDDANAALYYVAMRHFGGRAEGCAAAVAALRRGRLSPARGLQPFGDDPRRAVSELIRQIEGLLVHVDERAQRAVPTAGRTLRYALSLLRGEASDAYALWSALPETQQALELLQARVKLLAPASSTRLAVVLPGMPDADYSTEIEGHDLVARTTLPHLSPPHEKTGARTDLVFLNLDRARQLKPDGPVTPPVVTKRTSRRAVARLRQGLRAPISFDLVEPALPTASATYLILPITLWALERHRSPPSLYCADFYLGASAYAQKTYDAKEYLKGAQDWRLAYLAHDVFFVHAALRRWAEEGRIRPRGTLADLLALDGPTFAARIQGRWGPAPEAIGD